MKTIDTCQQKSKAPKIWKYILLGWIIFIIVVIYAILLALSFFRIVIGLGFRPRPYEVHHPALYYVQDNFFQLGDKVYYMNDGKCMVFDDNKETREIDLEHISNEFYVSNDILYIYLDDKYIYAYNSNFEEVSIYDVGFIHGRVGRRFIVLGDYIYFEGFNYDLKKDEIYKYSMITHTKEPLDWDGKYPAEFLSEGIYYYKLALHKYDDSIHYYGDSHVFYNKDYKRIELNEEKDKIVINDKSFNFEYPFAVDEVVYLNSECLVFSTYTPCIEDCSEYVTPCISQLTDVKLWKYNIKTEQLSLIKQFNDYTILISFDDNNYHYYYDGKLYSNDIEVEDAPKIEVGDMFTYYTAESDPNLYRKEILKSITNIAYISGEFYVIHEEINSDLEEFHGR
ncbi:MAG: hypothetical protein II788_02445 [Acholeplasmatales bacterium]|nr:hypothetical protein [Acholeplasmatales bacterium]